MEVLQVGEIFFMVECGIGGNSLISTIMALVRSLIMRFMSKTYFLLL